VRTRDASAAKTQQPLKLSRSQSIGVKHEKELRQHELAKRRVSSRMITTDKINQGLEIRRGKIHAGAALPIRVVSKSWAAAKAIVSPHHYVYYSR
jgi:hypothetical protein